MFTGLVETVGRVVEIHPTSEGRRFRIESGALAGNLKPSESISVNGVCLTVTDREGGSFLVQAVATTLSRTTLGGLEVGSQVNLERALALGDRLGGHLVQGHVDGVAEVLRVDARPDLLLIDFTLPADVAAVTVLHGSITVDGVSLTVNALPGAEQAQVAIIPYTRDHTTLGALEPGDRVNLEGDMIGKFVRHLLGNPRSGADLRGRWGY